MKPFVIYFNAFLILCLLVPHSVTYVSAAQFRSYKPIATPEPTPAGTTAATSIKPIRRAVVMQALQRLFDSWGNEKLTAYLSENFYDKSRLLDVIALDIPRDAKLRVLSVQNVQSLAQFIKPSGAAVDLTQTRVAVIARVQLEWNDATAGFQRLEGTSEYVLDITTSSAGEG